MEPPSVRILGAPTQPASLQSAGWVGAPKIRTEGGSTYTTSESTCFIHLAMPGIYRGFINCSVGNTSKVPLYYFRVNPVQPHSELAARRPRNSHARRTLTNWRNASTWYPSRAMAVETKTPAYMQPPRRVRRPRRGFTKNSLIAWLDEQERLIRRRGIPTEVVEELTAQSSLTSGRTGQANALISLHH